MPGIMPDITPAGITRGITITVAAVIFQSGLVWVIHPTTPAIRITMRHRFITIVHTRSTRIPTTIHIPLTRQAVITTTQRRVSPIIPNLV